MFDFKSYLSEATIVNQTKYGAGHKIELSKRATGDWVKDLEGKDLELADATPDAEEIGSGSESIYVKAGSKVYKIKGSKSGLNSSFNHKGLGGKSDTHKTTRCKEAMSLIVFKHYSEAGETISEDDAITQLSNWGADETVYNSVYYTSAVLQLANFKKIRPIQGKKLVFEFQGDKFCKKIYAKKAELGGPKSDDNWNPADVWVFDASFVSKIDSELGEIEHLNELNFWIRKSFLSGYLCPISLKQATGASKMELINPQKYKNKRLDYDFTLDRVVIAGSLKSVFIETKSGYTFKANSRAAATSTNLYLEGTFKSENFAMGAVDAKLWAEYHNGKVLQGNSIKPTNNLLNESKKTFNKYSRKILKKDNDILFNPDFKSMDKILQQRYIAAASLLKFVMENYKETIRWSFFTAMKVSDTNSMYVKIK